MSQNLAELFQNLAELFEEALKTANIPNCEKVSPQKLLDWVVILYPDVIVPRVQRIYDLRNKKNLGINDGQWVKIVETLIVLDGIKTIEVANKFISLFNDIKRTNVPYISEKQFSDIMSLRDIHLNRLLDTNYSRTLKRHLPEYDDIDIRHLIGLKGIIRQIYNQFVNGFDISIEGPGGIGKTSIALKLIYEIIEKRKPKLDDVFFIAIRPKYATQDGIKNREVQQSVEDTTQLLDTLAEQAQINVSNKTVEEKVEQFQRIFNNRSIIIIIDNIENESEAEEIKYIVKLFKGFDNNIRFILTSRIDFPKERTSIEPCRVPELKFNNAHLLLTTRCKELTRNETREIYSRVGGHPLALKFITNLINEDGFPEVIKELEKRKADNLNLKGDNKILWQEIIYNYVYSRNVELLDTDCFRLLYRLVYNYGISDGVSQDYVKSQESEEDRNVEGTILELKSRYFITFNRVTGDLLMHRLTYHYIDKEYIRSRN